MKIKVLATSILVVFFSAFFYFVSGAAAQQSPFLQCQLQPSLEVINVPNSDFYVTLDCFGDNSIRDDYFLVITAPNGSTFDTNQFSYTSVGSLYPISVDLGENPIQGTYTATLYAGGVPVMNAVAAGAVATEFSYREEVLTLECGAGVDPDLFENEEEMRNACPDLCPFAPLARSSYVAWCSCGFEIGEACCTSDNIYNIGGGGCIEGLVCVAGTCNSNRFKCGGDLGIGSAIGCIPLSSSSALVEFFLRWGIGISGGLTLLLSVYGAFLVMTSRGDPKKIQHGQSIIVAAISGAFLIVLSVFVLSLLGVDILRIPGFSR